MGQVDEERLERNEKITNDVPPPEEEMLEVWLRRWGVSSKAPLAFYYSPGEALTTPMPGFRTETVYTPCVGPTAWHSPWKFQMPTVVVNAVSVKKNRGIPWPDDDPDLLLIEVRFRIWKPGISTFEEMRLDPVTWESHVDLRDIDERSARNPTWLNILLDAVRTHIDNKPGPEPGSILYPDADDFLARCTEELHLIIEQDGELRGAKTKVANALGIDPKTLKNHLQYHGLPSEWNAFVAYVLQLTRKEQRGA